MNKFSFDFYNENYTQRIDLTTAVTYDTPAGLLVFVDAGAMDFVQNDITAAELDHVYIIAEDIPAGQYFFIGYPIRTTDWIDCYYKSVIATQPLVGQDVIVHQFAPNGASAGDGYAAHALEVTTNGVALFEIVKINTLSVDSSAALTVDVNSNTTAANTLFTLTANVIDINITGHDEVYRLAANYTTGGNAATIVTYKAPCVIKLI